MCLYAELIVDEDCVSGDGNGAIGDGGCVSLEAFVGTIKSEWCGETLYDGGWDDRVPCEQHLRRRHARAGMLRGIVSDA